MQAVNVLFTWRVPEEFMGIAAGVDPRVRVAAAPYIEPEERRDLRRKGRLSELDSYPVAVPQELRDRLREADVIYGLDFPNGLPSLAPRLRWVQLIGAGADHLAGTGLMESQVTITSTGGFSSRNIAEYCINLMLCHVKHTKEYILAQPAKGWNRIFVDSLAGKTVGIVGYGRIGSMVARFAKAFDMGVLAVRRTPAPEPPPHVDRMYAASGLVSMLPLCDFVVISVALTPETRQLIGQRELGMMKPSAYLINVARGEVVDEEALVEALRDGRIAGAGLDVFKVEPLPPGSPLWEMPSVIVTPHSSAAIANYASHAARYFAENLTRFMSGQPLMNVVDKRKGY